MKRSASASRSSVLIPGRRISFIRARVPATIRPARAMISTSRADFKVIILVVEGTTYSRSNLFDRTDGGNAAEQVSFLIPVEHRGGLLPVSTEPGGDRSRIVVGALLDGAALCEP